MLAGEEAGWESTHELRGAVDWCVHRVLGLDATHLESSEPLSRKILAFSSLQAYIGLSYGITSAPETRVGYNRIPKHMYGMVMVVFACCEPLCRQVGDARGARGPCGAPQPCPASRLAVARRRALLAIRAPRNRFWARGYVQKKSLLRDMIKNNRRERLAARA
jgi:hypothetical protein